MKTYEIGDVLPDMRVADPQGSLKPLSAQMGEKGLVIFVLRGTWCPSCVSQIHGVQRNYNRYTRHGVTTVFISPEDARTIDNFRLSMPAPLRFGLHSDPKRETSEFFIPVPDEDFTVETATYLINHERQVVWSCFGNPVHDFPSHEQLLAAIESALNTG